MEHGEEEPSFNKPIQEPIEDDPNDEPFEEYLVEDPIEDNILSEHSLSFTNCYGRWVGKKG